MTLEYNNKILEDKQEQAALYALGALSQHEARAFENRLRDGDNEAQKELESFEKVVEALGFNAEPVQPPAYIFDVLTSRLQRKGHQPVSSTVPKPESKPATPASSIPPSVATTPTNVVELKRKSPMLSFIPWALAASLAVCSLLTFFAWRSAQEAKDAVH